MIYRARLSTHLSVGEALALLDCASTSNSVVSQFLDYVLQMGAHRQGPEVKFDRSNPVQFSVQQSIAIGDGGQLLDDTGPNVVPQLPVTDAAGLWQSSHDYCDVPRYGKCCTRLVLRREVVQTDDLKQVGEVGVDSGSIVIADADQELPRLSGDEVMRLRDQGLVSALPNGAGLLAESGFGDGLYPVLAAQGEDGQLSLLIIPFIYEDDLDDYFE